MKRIIILGAAGRDFHNFNVVYRNDADYRVVAFTATQIPDIADRSYPPELADPPRAGHELAYFLGEVNLRRANVVIINKVDTATPEAVEQVRANIRRHNPQATVIEAACRVSVPEPEKIKGKKVLVVEDGPTVTHGGMAYGAGVVAARQ